MSNALYIGATGMQAQQQNVDTIANNLANANTTAFKKSRISFTDMMVQDASRVSNLMAGMTELDAGSMGVNVGAGVRVSSTSKSFEPAELKKTDSALDIAIQGEGFIEVLMSDGSTAFSRGGTLKLNRDNQLSLASGHLLKAGITIPDHVLGMTISPDGFVRCRVAGQSGELELGKIELVNFTSPSQLNVLGDNLYQTTAGSGEALSSLNGELGVGTIAQGSLEASNVKMVEEMVNLMIAQRTYEANVKLVQAADEMHGMINSLRK